MPNISRDLFKLVSFSNLSRSTIADSHTFSNTLCLAGDYEKSSSLFFSLEEVSSTDEETEIRRFVSKGSYVHDVTVFFCYRKRPRVETSSSSERNETGCSCKADLTAFKDRYEASFTLIINALTELKKEEHATRSTVLSAVSELQHAASEMKSVLSGGIISTANMTSIVTLKPPAMDMEKHIAWFDSLVRCIHY